MEEFNRISNFILKKDFYMVLKRTMKFNTFYIISSITILAVIMGINSKLLSGYSSGTNTVKRYNWFNPYDIWKFPVDQYNLSKDSFINEIKTPDFQNKDIRYVIILDKTNPKFDFVQPSAKKNISNWLIERKKINSKLKIPNEYCQSANSQDLIALMLGTYLKFNLQVPDSLIDFKYYIDRPNGQLNDYIIKPGDTNPNPWYSLFVNSNPLNSDSSYQGRDYFPDVIKSIIDEGNSINNLTQFIFVSEFSSNNISIEELDSLLLSTKVYKNSSFQINIIDANNNGSKLFSNNVEQSLFRFQNNIHFFTLDSNYLNLMCLDLFHQDKLNTEFLAFTQLNLNIDDILSSYENVEYSSNIKRNKVLKFSVDDSYKVRIPEITNKIVKELYSFNDKSKLDIKDNRATLSKGRYSFEIKPDQILNCDEYQNIIPQYYFELYSDSDKFKYKIIFKLVENLDTNVSILWILILSITYLCCFMLITNLTIFTLSGKHLWIIRLSIGFLVVNGLWLYLSIKSISIVILIFLVGLIVAFLNWVLYYQDINDKDNKGIDWRNREMDGNEIKTK